MPQILKVVFGFTLFFAAVLSYRTVRAEMPPGWYETWKRNAPEYLRVKIESVKTHTVDKDEEHEVIQVQVKARVSKVIRSRSGTKPNDSITITYEHIRYAVPVAGNAINPIVEKAREYPAYLTRTTDGYFVPAVRGLSFQE